MRSKNKDFIFFEDAKNPIMTLEALRPEKDDSGDQQQLASVGFAPYINAMLSSSSGHKQNKQVPLESLLLKRVDLSSVDLHEGRYSTKVSIDTRKLKEYFGTRKWSKTTINVSVCDDFNKNGICSDENMRHTLTVSSPTFSVRNMPDRILVDVWNGRHLTYSKDPEYCEKQYSPIVLDIEGNGISLSGAEDGVYFDLNDEGSAIRTGWTAGADDAFLVRDLNNNRRIDSGAELFGSATRLKNGKRAPNGFEAMKELDSDQDGKLTAKDNEWRSLLLWFDKNHNGLTDKGELKSLRDYGVESMNLNYIEMMEIDNYGNQTRERSTFTRRVSGRLKAQLIIDVWFNTLVGN
jgi:hypothetical protein